MLTRSEYQPNSLRETFFEYPLRPANRSYARVEKLSNHFGEFASLWKLAKDPANRAVLMNTLASLVRQLARQAVYLWPFMPKKSEELWKSLGAPGSPGEMRFSELERLDPTGWKVEKGPPLFPKAEA